MTLPSALLLHLNDVQKEAVCADPSKPLLLIAGAGSGKTRVLTHRIAYLIASGVSPFEIIGITFTNKAAGEMRQRVERLVNQRVWLSTFHSACLQILRMDGHRVGLRKNFAIYDETDQLVLVKECMKHLEINDRQVNPKGVREMIQRAKDFLKTPEMMTEAAQDHFESTAAKIYFMYQQTMSDLHGCDFGDLIMKTVLLFNEYPAVLESWHERFRYLFVDEYQDTNHAQYIFLNQLASKYRRVTVVGDPDQSIYAWRGADIQNILRFEEDYPNAVTLNLEQNYRSTQNILNAANHLIQFNLSRKPKNLWTKKNKGEKISLYEAVDEKDEADYVVRTIRSYLSEGKTLADMVIFYRLHTQSRVFEDALRKYKLPYKIVGGIRFYDRREIKDLIAYLRVVAFSDDDVSCKRIVNVPARGIGKKGLSLIEAYQKLQHLSFFDALKQVDQIEGIGEKTKSSIHHFCEFIETLRASKKELTVQELLKDILRVTNYESDLEAERTIESRVRLENIKEFFSAVQEFEENWKEPLDAIPTEKGKEVQEEDMLESFLSSIALQTDVDEWNQELSQLTMMTLHCAKGLEFPMVFMVGMEEEIFPHVYSTDSVNSDDLEEERRLCYVGMTRAKEKLHLTFADSRRLYGSQHHNLPSRFLNEIPSDLYDTSDIIDERIEFELEDQNFDDDTKRKVLFG